jgi:hypothetical protein
MENDVWVTADCTDDCLGMLLQGTSLTRGSQFTMRRVNHVFTYEYFHDSNCRRKGTFLKAQHTITSVTVKPRHRIRVFRPVDLETRRYGAPKHGERAGIKPPIRRILRRHLE